MREDNPTNAQSAKAEAGLKAPTAFLPLYEGIFLVDCRRFIWEEVSPMSLSSSLTFGLRISCPPQLLGRFYPRGKFSLDHVGTLCLFGSLPSFGTLARYGSLATYGTLWLNGSLFFCGTLPAYGSLILHGTLS
jgi:hypothetical protein